MGEVMHFVSKGTGRPLGAVLRGLARAAALLALAPAAPALAEPVLCAAAAEAEFSDRPAKFVEAGCKIAERDGAHQFRVECPDDEPNVLGLRHVPGQGDVVQLLFLPEAKTLDELLAPCGLQRARFETVVKPDNVVVREVGEFSGRGGFRGDLHAALFGFGDDGENLLLLRRKEGGSSLLYDFQSVLREVLEARYGSGTLSFTSSPVRVAGVDIVEADGAALLAELEKRGSKVLERSNILPWWEDVRLSPAVGVPGLKEIKVSTAGGRVMTVAYLIPERAAYTEFHQALDERYGASARSTWQGCPRRHWDSGGVTIVGVYCEAKPAESGFTFSNDGLRDIVRAYLDKYSERLKEQGEASRKPTLDKDMF